MAYIIHGLRLTEAIRREQRGEGIITIEQDEIGVATFYRQHDSGYARWGSPGKALAYVRLNKARAEVAQQGAAA